MNIVEITTDKIQTANGQPEKKRQLPVREIAFDRPRDFLNNRFVYAVLSPRARGLTLGVNMNPDQRCNFDCLYCEVNRATPPEPSALDVGVMASELHRTLDHIQQGRLREHPQYQSLPDELLQLRHVALSGDGEPTLSPQFAEILQAVVHIRALGGLPFFKIVLLTNGTGLDRVQVQESLKRFTKSDEIWVKLDGGTQEYSGQSLPVERRDARKNPVQHPASGAPAPGGHPKPVPGHQRRGAVGGRHRAIRAPAQGIEVRRRADFPRPDLFRQPPHVARRMRASAAQDPFPNRAGRPAGVRIEGGSVLTAAGRRNAG